MKYHNEEHAHMIILYVVGYTQTLLHLLVMFQHEEMTRMNSGRTIQRYAPYGRLRMRRVSMRQAFASLSITHGEW